MKIKFKHKQQLLVCLLIATVILSYGVRVKKDGAALKSVDLRSIPTEMGPWHMVKQQFGASAVERNFLNDVLFRCYQRPDGRAIVLAVAYGADQRQNFSIHVPEGCYRASGYDVTSLGITRLTVPDLRLKQLYAQKENSVESIQYWIVLNGKVVTNHFERKFKQLYYSLLGAKAGGVLVRITSNSTLKDTTNEFEVQKDFITNLFAALNNEQRNLLFGTI